MDEIKEPVEDVPTENLQVQLNAAQEEIQSLTQQLNCLLVLTKNAWRGDESATIHLARVIGIDPQVEQNAFVEKKITERITSARKTVTIGDNDNIMSKQTPSIASSASQENVPEQRKTPVPPVSRNKYLQPFLKQSHIDPIREQDPNRIFNNMVRHHQNEMRRPPIIVNRNSSANVRPRATKHLYRPASPENVVRHLGSPISRVKPYFVFAGREFFQQTTNYSPLYQRAVGSANGSRHSRQSNFSDESENIASTSTAEPVIVRPHTAKSVPQSSTLRFGIHSAIINGPPRASSALSSTSSTKLTQVSDRDRHAAMQLQRQLNLPRQGWLNQQS